MVGCNPQVNRNDDKIEKWKEEILTTEESFVSVASEQGIAPAFLRFAADDAVLLRQDSLYIGKEAITDFFKHFSPERGTLTWKPDYVDVSASGDLGYTYGKFVYTYTDTSDQEKKVRGIFHTVWKLYHDGNWKFVWN